MITVSVSTAEEDGNYDRYICLAGVIVFTLILMIWTFSHFRKRRRMQEMAWSLDEGLEVGRVKCTNCNKPVPEDVDECPHCHEPFEGTEEVCPFCDTKLPGGAKKCPLCKKRFTGKKGKVSKEKLACPECGAVVERDQKVCPGCDLDLREVFKLKTKKGKAAEKKGDVYMCSICGGDVKESDETCGKCGIRFS